MVKFVPSTVDTWLVVNNDKPFGVIKNDGLSIGDCFVTGKITLSSDDLRQIADKVDEVKQQKASDNG